MTELRTIQERLRAEAELIAIGHQEPMYLPGTAAHETDQWKAADRLDALEDVLRDATEAESLLKPEQRSPWFTKAVAALTPKVPT